MADLPNMVRSVPDPSELTTSQLIREIESAKAQTASLFAALNDLISEKLAGVDKIFEEQRRAMTTAEQEREKSATALRENLLSVIEGDRRAIQVAEQEREKAASALRAAIAVAEQEREKAAQALRIELARAITDGDANLKDHVSQQVHQIKAALEAAGILEVQRIDGLRKEMQLIFDSSEEAIAKAEKANEKRFDAVNEFRDQQKDIIAQFMPREVADNRFAELTKKVDTLTVGANVSRGNVTGAKDARTGFANGAQLAIAGLGLIVAVLSVVVVVVLSTH